MPEPEWWKHHEALFESVAKRMIGNHNMALDNIDDLVQVTQNIAASLADAYAGLAEVDEGIDTVVETIHGTGAGTPHALMEAKENVTSLQERVERARAYTTELAELIHSAKDPS